MNLEDMNNPRPEAKEGPPAQEEGQSPAAGENSADPTGPEERVHVDEK